MKKFNVGVIGLGNRGKWLATFMLPRFKNVNIVGICDKYSDRVEACDKELSEKSDIHVTVKTTDYFELIHSDEVEVVLVFSSWNNHIPAVLACMKASKPVAFEVGGVYSIDQCYELVKTYEQTKTPVMMLENCCYGNTELTLLNMCKNGIFGQLVHCKGGYMHDLRNEIAYGIEKRHYRFLEYKNRNCDNYPTHDIGPLAKMLDINRGNRFVSLVSMTTKAFGLHEYINAHDDIKDKYGNTDFSQGDICSTLIKCSNGQTVELTLDTTLPRYYSRNMTVRGTKGMYEENTHSFMFDGVKYANEWDWTDNLNNEGEYMKKWKHPIWQKYEEDGVEKAGHGGMDYLVINAFFTALEEHFPMPIDIYDAVTWMSISPLSEKSIALGSQPVDFPDFTSGEWYYSDVTPDWKYKI